MNSLAGKRFWLIGASAGIGRDLALRLAREGVAVVASARDGAALDDVVATMAPVQTACGGHEAVPFDATDSEGTMRAFSRVGTVNGVIYCAGAYEPMSAREPRMDVLERTVDVNFTGALRVLAACVPSFCRRGFGHIVLLGSLAGYRGLPDAWGYGATKAALIHLAENLRLDLRDSGVVVQVCNPGFVATRLTDKNSFPMPFIMTPEAAADRIVRGMARQQFEIAFPRIMTAVFKLFATVPRPVYFALMRMAGRKRERAS